jgi:hypothetical protein
MMRSLILHILDMVFTNRWGKKSEPKSRLLLSALVLLSGIFVGRQP